MSEYFTNSLVVLTSFLAVIICVVGLSSVFSKEAKADEIAINTQMIELKKLYVKLNSFYKTPTFHKNGYGTLGSGNWSSRLKFLSKDTQLKNYMKSLVPEPVEHEFLYDQPLEPNHLWYIGRYYMRNVGAENKSTLAVKAKFQKLFKLHELRRK